ncbi:hypothetical protein P3T36_005444 [Kitasatospora sp. MAP12-15]|uniref:hypothetical protein n=1 Tax=unclassified Kitasatospora TaxID=2633591 RepID=UPI0024763687|nr:hypothetical protein [Kitasatospora sp. MAP12-44]MDH6109755.1 hypothetical protein [Kitasatospora sp. MAP12-44]
MGLFKDAPPSAHPEYTQLRFMAAGTPSWWKQNRHKVLAIAGLLSGFWLAGHLHDTTPRTCTPASPSVTVSH